MGISAAGIDVVPVTRNPPADLLRAGRSSSVVAATIGILCFFAVARRIVGRSRALLAVALLGLSPAWMAAARHARTDIHAISFSLLATWLLIRSREWLFERRSPALALAGAVGCGLAIGAAVGSKLSAAGPAAGLGGLILWEALAPSRWCAAPSDPRTRAGLFVGGVVLIVSSLAVFVGSYPFLWHDPWPAFRGVVAAWSDVRDWVAANGGGRWEGAYRPGLRSFTEMARVFLVPGAWAAIPVFAVAVGAALARRVGFEGEERSAMRRAGTWAAVGLAAPIVAWQPGILGIAWIAWVGLAGAVITGRAGFRVDGTRALRAAWVFWAVTLFSALFVLRSTYITWTRYYLWLFPAVSLIGAVGLFDLRATARRIGGRRLDLATFLVIATGLVASAGALPKSNLGQLKWLSTLSPRSVAVGGTVVSALVLVLVVVAGIGPVVVRSLRPPVSLPD